MSDDYKKKFAEMKAWKRSAVIRLLSLPVEKRERILKLEALRRGLDHKTGKPYPDLPPKT